MLFNAMKFKCPLKSWRKTSLRCHPSPCMALWPEGCAHPSWRKTIINNSTGQVQHQQDRHSFSEPGLRANSSEKYSYKTNVNFPA